VISHVHLHTPPQTKDNPICRHGQDPRFRQRRGSAARRPSSPGGSNPGHAIHAPGGEPGAFLLPAAGASSGQVLRIRGATRQRHCPGHD
ncbi:MAG TPA: hypothetical protein DD643_06755, partial [Synechococcus sp. UBA8638]|nr:hypothetical protein [Synechococcus sp. UBA8638]